MFEYFLKVKLKISSISVHFLLLCNNNRYLFKIYICAKLLRRVHKGILELKIPIIKSIESKFWSAPHFSF